MRKTMMPAREVAMRARNYDGPALFSYGFRPFFLLGSVYAGLAILMWLPVFMGELSLVSAFIPRDGHVHEMLYGFLPAVITGFLFTAIPNWTGRLPLRGDGFLDPRHRVEHHAGVGIAIALGIFAEKPAAPRGLHEGFADRVIILLARPRRASRDRG